MKFGTLPRKFSPPRATRGGYMGFFAKKEESPLTGEVQGLKAAQGEERLARTIEKSIRKGFVREHYFRWTSLRRGVVGYKELDELVILANGQAVAISVKGEDFVHRSAASKNQDKLNEIILLDALRKKGYQVGQIISVAAADLNTQEQADRVAKKLGIYR